MFGTRDPKKIEQMMKKLNINTRELAAHQVIIKTDEGDLVIEQPEIMVMNMMGRDVYQISGSVKPAAASAVREEDIQLVMAQTGKDRDTVVRKLEETHQDLARAILELKSA